MEICMNVIKFSPIDSIYSAFEIHDNNEIVCEVITDDRGSTKILFSEYSAKVELAWEDFFEKINDISERLVVNKRESLENEDFLKKISKA